MTRSDRRIAMVLGILLASVLIGSGLLALEGRLAPLPGPGDSRTFDESVDDLEASTARWKWIYLPALQLTVVVGVGLLISGRHAWLQAIVASIFVFGLVFIHHATTSLKSAAIFVPIYLVAGAVIATLVRRVKARAVGLGTETVGADHE